MSQKLKIPGTRVLVIDDEPEITDIVEAFLSEAGYTVDSENDPINAIPKVGEFNAADFTPPDYSDGDSETLGVGESLRRWRRRTKALPPKPGHRVR